MVQYQLASGLASRLARKTAIEVDRFFANERPVSTRLSTFRMDVRRGHTALTLADRIGPVTRRAFAFSARSPRATLLLSPVGTRST
jgi:hypothetical protein